MADANSFLDNLANLSLVMSVALEHVQSNRDQFARSSNGEQSTQAERFISKIRTLEAELDKELKLLESSLTEKRRLM
jgi:hypothetical protein